jgi:membrane dipeptidase
VARIVRETIGIDMHNHVHMVFAGLGGQAGPDPGPLLASQINRSGFSAICQTYAVDAETLSTIPGEYADHYRQGLDYEDRVLARNHLQRALNLTELRAAHAQGHPIVIQACEGAQFIEGKVERIEHMHQRGLRVLQLVHEQDDTTAPLGDFDIAPAGHPKGLTGLGERVVKECNRLGIVVDLAHGTFETAKGALKIATQPPIFSHVCLGTEIRKQQAPDGMRRRLISAEHARAIAQAGGVVGIWWRLANSMSEYVLAVKEMVDVVGVDHVGIGTDSEIAASYAYVYTNQIWPEQDSGFFYAFAAEMLNHGFSPAEVAKIGGDNFCRVFGAVTTRA